jgi:glycerate dehydrogenase
MRIVVVDGYTLNPGDLSWSELEALGECTVHDRTPSELVHERVAGAQIVLTNKVVFSRPVMERLPELKYIGVLATGYNVVDTAAAAERGIVVTNVPAYSTLSVAQLVFAHVLNLAHRPAEHSQGVRAGKWSRSVDFSYWDSPLVELAGLTMGIVGFGRIGQAVARVAAALGMNVLAHTRGRNRETADHEYDHDHEGERETTKGKDENERGKIGQGGVEFVSLEEVFRRGDVVSLHCPLTEQTRGLVNAQRLAMMKPTAFLINTARGPLVVEAALADALNAGRIAGAGLDVLGAEPPPRDNPLLTARNCYITPHVGWATQAARRRLMVEAVENVRAFLGGRRRNVVG